MPATTINQLIVDTKGMSTQDVYIEVYENKPRKVEKKRVQTIHSVAYSFQVSMNIQKKVKVILLLAMEVLTWIMNYLQPLKKSSH